MIKLLTAGAVALAFSFAPASANDTEAECETYAKNNDTDASGCACLGEAAAADPVLAEALSAISTPADLEAADDATREAVGACFPDA